MFKFTLLKKKLTETYRRLQRPVLVVGVLLGLVIVAVAGGIVGYHYYPYSTVQDKHVAFIGDVYDQIKVHYWQEIPDEQLSTMFALGVQKLKGQNYTLKVKNQEGVERLVGTVIRDLVTPEEKKQFVLQLSQLVLNSLEPKGKNKVFSQSQTQKLAERVNNINKADSPYETLGTQDSASIEDIQNAYEGKVEELAEREEEAETEEEVAEVRETKKKVEQARAILSDEQSRELYDKAGAHATVYGKVVSSEVFYVRITRFAPRTFAEFVKMVNSVNDIKTLNSLVLDLRGNIGGSIDILQQFLGPFIGKDEYAYEFYHQGDREPFKTTTGWLPSLVKYKKNIILVDGDTQSTAEVMAATLKKYNVGVLVGETTKGWGTVEKLFSLDSQITDEEKYSLFLVHSVTLRNDEQPIQGRGVDPVIDMSKENWQEKLAGYFDNQRLIKTVGEIWRTPPS